MGRHHTDDEQVQALVHLAANDGNVRQTSRELGMPPATLRRWRDAIMPELQNVQTVSQTVPLAVSAPSLAERVRAEVEYIGFGNLSDVVSWDADGHLRFVPSAELTPLQAALIGEIRVKRRFEAGKDQPTYEIEDFAIKGRDKLAALRLLAEITGLKPEKGASVTFNDNRVLVTAEAERLAERLGLDPREILIEAEAVASDRS